MVLGTSVKTDCKMGCKYYNGELFLPAC